MATKSTLTLIRSSVGAYYGTAGATASTDVGYIPGEENVVITFDRNVEMFKAQGADLPVAAHSRPKNLRVSIPLSQLGDLDIMGLAMGLTQATGVLTLGDPSLSAQVPQVSLAIIGEDVQGNVWRVDVPYASVVEATEVEVGQETTSMVRAVFAGLDYDGASFPTITYNGGGVEATLSGGTLTIASGIHKILGEGGVADAWTAFAGLVEADDQSIYRFYGGSSAYAITATHLNGTLELIGDANFALGGSAAGLRSFIDCRYDHATTALIAVNQFDATL